MADSTFEEHIASTNSRLASIRASLVDASTFPQACEELTKWCSDQRAFTAHFEENLMLALQVAMENGSKENFDFNLTHLLVSACFSHRKYLSKPSATQISRWYEQMRRLKKNGGKRKRAPPKPKEPLVQPSTVGPLPVLTSPGAAPGASNSENNSLMFSPSSDGSMWTQGPIGGPGSSGHMPPGAPFPGPMNHPPGMYPPPGQMSLPYGQMEGNHAMYEQRMLAARAAGRPGMMPPDYAQMQMGQNQPGAPVMMNRMPMQYPQGHPQMAGHPQMQYGQMMRAPPVSVYGQMNHPQPYPVTAHPNPSQGVLPADLKHIYDTCVAWRVERSLLEEGEIPLGSNGFEAQVAPESVQHQESSNDVDLILSIWPIAKGAEEVPFECYLNERLVMNHMTMEKSVSVKPYLKSGTNLFHFIYNSQQKMHRYSCEFVSRIPFVDLRKYIMYKKGTDFNQLVFHSRTAYIQMAQRRQAGVVSVSMNCCLSKKKMVTPVRHGECKKAIFELGNLMNINKNKTRYLCPQCSSYFKLDDISIDYFMMSMINQMAPATTDLLVEKNGAVRPGDVEKDDVKPKRGKKKNEESSSNGIKRIKSETFVKQEPGVYHDIHGRAVPFSPMPMPGSVPPDWSRLQSPSFSMHSPNKIQLGPATPATPGMIYQNPASVGSMMNMSSPRQTVMMPGQPPVTIPNEQQMPAASGSAPYTPESVVSDHDYGLGHINDDLALIGKPLVITSEEVVKHYLKQTTRQHLVEFDSGEYDAELVHIREPNARLLAHASTSSTNFTPPFDDIHLGSRPSH